MADLESLAGVKANLALVTIGADSAPLFAKVGWKYNYKTKPISSARYGEEVLAHLVVGREGELVFEFQQVDDVIQKRFLSTTGTPGETLVVGQQLPAELVRIHDPQAGNANGDIVFYKVVWTGAEREIDGKGEAVLKVTGKPILDLATGKFGKIGA